MLCPSPGFTRLPPSLVQSPRGFEALGLVGIGNSLQLLVLDISRNPFLFGLVSRVGSSVMLLIPSDSQILTTPRQFWSKAGEDHEHSDSLFRFSSFETDTKRLAVERRQAKLGTEGVLEPEPPS